MKSWLDNETLETIREIRRKENMGIVYVSPDDTEIGNKNKLSIPQSVKIFGIILLVVGTIFGVGIGLTIGRFLCQ